MCLDKHIRLRKYFRYFKYWVNSKVILNKNFSFNLSFGEQKDFQNSNVNNLFKLCGK